VAPPKRLTTGIDAAFGRVLREIRLEQGLSQEALGLASGNGRTFVSQLERGERGASLKTLFRLAPCLDTTPTEVIAKVEAGLGKAAEEADLIRRARL
jgi:transcriptional regulator with XRE-family HTH domain